MPRTHCDTFWSIPLTLVYLSNANTCSTYLSHSLIVSRSNRKGISHIFPSESISDENIWAKKSAKRYQQSFRAHTFAILFCGLRDRIRFDFRYSILTPMNSRIVFVCMRSRWTIYCQQFYLWPTKQSNSYIGFSLNTRLDLIKSKQCVSSIAEAFLSLSLYL